MPPKPPPRPKLVDYVGVAIDDFVDRINRDLFSTNPLSESEVEVLRQVLRYGADDGYQLARDLDRNRGQFRSRFISADLVDWLDSFSTCDAQDDADRAWREQHAALIDPLRPEIDACVSYQDHQGFGKIDVTVEGVIVAIDDGRALCTVSSAQLGHVRAGVGVRGRVIRWEDLTALEPETWAIGPDLSTPDERKQPRES